MATTLLSLPPELLANVFVHLEDASFFSGRLANRQLEQASFTLFGRRFFRKKGYMITSPSLDVLRSVSSHEKLRLYVQHVWFNPDCYTYGSSATMNLVKDTRGPGTMPEIHPFSNYPAESKGEYIRSRFMLENKALLTAKALFTGDRHLFDVLKSTFAALPNLKTVGMRRSDQHNPWGWSRLRDAVGQDPRELGDTSNVSTGIPGPVVLYLNLMHALSASGSRIQRLYTDAVQVDDIPLWALPPTVMREACSSLLYLEINVSKGDYWKYEFPEDHSDDSNGVGLVRLLSACPYLRELGLMIFPDRYESHFIPPEGGWHQSYMFSVLTHLTENIQLCNLRRIKLEKFIALPSTLIALLQPSAPHLTSIKLRDIRLLEEGDEDKPWRPIFAFLATSCNRLSYLLLYHLYHASGGIRFVQNLPPHPPRPDEDPDVVSSTDYFTDYENIAVEVGMPHSDPDTEGPERRASILRARETVSDRVRSLVNGHWYGKNLFSYEMDEMLWHTDTSDEEW